MTPKFKSFQAVQVPNHVGTQTDVFVYALGEDGIVYMTDATGRNNWWPLLNNEAESTLEKEIGE